MPFFSALAPLPHMDTKMARHAYFIARDSDYERFLAAPLWDEDGGKTLSVMSAFARLGLEPWNETDRLMTMPSGGAIRALAKTLARVPFTGPDKPDYQSIAAQLHLLLPKTRNIRDAVSNSGRSLPLLETLFLLVIAGALVTLQMSGYLF